MSQNKPIPEPPLWLLLVLYAAASFTFSYLCGKSGTRYNPLAAYQTYAVAYLGWFLVGCVVVRPRRLWPPTRDESLSAFSSGMILTSETLSLMLPGSLTSIIAGKAGCLLLPDPTDKRPFRQRATLSVITFLAIILASIGKPLRVAIIPLALACLYVAGYQLKLKSCRPAKDNPEAKPGYLSAGQALVLLICLSLSSLFGRFVPPAPLLEWRLWLIAGASLLCGLIGVRMLVHRARQGVVFPAYRSMSLCCALAAGWARGEHLQWSGVVAILLALLVIGSAVREEIQSWWAGVLIWFSLRFGSNKTEEDRYRQAKIAPLTFSYSPETKPPAL